MKKAVLVGCLAVPVLLAGAPAHAAARLFRLPREPLDRAMLRFALQGGVSVGGDVAGACTGLSRPVTGVMSPASALARMLPPGCRFEQIDPRAFRIGGQAAPAPVRPPPPSAPVRPVEVDQLIVTSEKRSEPLIGSPFAVSALPATDAKRLGGDTFGALAPQFVGVTVTNLGPGRDKILLRGLSDGAFSGVTQSMVGIYLDDTPITYNAPDPDLRLADIDRVEVLRGPQGTLYGSGSMGGVVHIVTARPDPSGLAGYVVGGTDLTDAGAPSNRLEAMANVPLGQRVALRAVGYSDESGGFLDNPGLGISNSNESRRWGGRIGLLGNLPGGWRAQATLVHQSIDTSDAQYTSGGSGSPDRRTQVIEPSDNDFTETAVSLTHSGPVVETHITAGFVDHVLRSQYDATGAFPAAPAANGPAAFDATQKVSLGVLEATAASSRAGRARWLLGAFFSQAREVDTGELDLQPGHRILEPIYRRRDRLQEAALYGEASYEVTSRATLTAGLRWFRTHRSSHSESFDPAQPAVADGELTDPGLAPKLRVSYAAAPDLVVYAQAQKGYRAGGFNVPAPGSPGPGPTPLEYGLDSMWSYEIGGVAPLFDRRLSLRLAAFHVDWRRLQSDQFLQSGLPVALNVGDAAGDGLEAEALWRPNAHWQVRMNAFLDDARLVSLSSPLPAKVHAGLPVTPGQLESTDVLYRWAAWSGVEAEVSLQAAYVGRSHVTFAATPAALMGGYGEARLEAALATGHWRLRAHVDNLTNAAGNTFAFGNPFISETSHQVTPLRPRTLGLELQWNF